MNIKKRIQEALIRRHKNEDGFTLIELLVVILIIAILAAVAIFALLSSLGSANKSNAKSTLSSAKGTVVATQSGLGQTDFTGLIIAGNTTATPTGPGTGVLDKAEKDAWFTSANLTGASPRNAITYEKAATNKTVYLTSRDDDDNCFYVILQVGNQTGYAANKVANSTTACAHPTAAPTDPMAQTTAALSTNATRNTWGSDQKIQWAI